MISRKFCSLKLWESFLSNSTPYYFRPNLDKKVFTAYKSCFFFLTKSILKEEKNSEDSKLRKFIKVTYKEVRQKFYSV
jgi:hypothetical protein